MKSRNNDKPRISDIMEAVFDAGYLLFDLVTGIVIMLEFPQRTLKKVDDFN